MKIGNLEIYGVIYKITNLINKKVYIGQTSRENGFKDRYCSKGEGIERVYNYYKYNLKKGKICNNHLMKSIEKYGFEAFEVNEVFDVAFSRKELDIKEKIYINYYNSTNNLFGYNIEEGGKGGLSKNTKDKIKRKTSRPIYCKETKQVFDSIASAEKYFNKNNISINRKTYTSKGILHFEYVTNNKKYKPIICLNDGNLFYSVRECQKYYSTSNIMNICKGKHKNKKIKNIKYYFMYVCDYFDTLDYETSKENADYIMNNYNNYIEMEFYFKDKTLNEKKEFILNNHKTLIVNMVSENKSYKEIASFLNNKLNLSFRFVGKNIKEFIEIEG